jgi:TnpA family transposase
MSDPVRCQFYFRRGKIRDRSAEGQHYRIAGMNPLAANIIFWNTMKLGDVVANQKRDGKRYHPISWPTSPRSDRSTSISRENIDGRTL